jgi:hypothetical protein
LSFQLKAIDQSRHGGGEHLLIARLHVGAVRAREGNARAAEDGDPA